MRLVSRREKLQGKIVAPTSPLLDHDVAVAAFLHHMPLPQVQFDAL